MLIIPTGSALDTLLVLSLSTEEHIHSLHNVILLRVVRVLFAGDLQNGRDGLIVILQHVSNIISNVLCDQNNTNIVPLGKFLEGLLHLNQLCIGLNDEKVGGVGRSVANASQEETGDGILRESNNPTQRIDPWNEREVLEELNEEKH